jgi:outer membrane immunogenic protein
MRRVVSAGIGLLALLAAPASAADMAVKAGPVFAPKFSWTGCYGGAFAGGAATQRDTVVTDLDGYNAVGSFGYQLDHSFIVGGLLGCNYQTGIWVFGIEGEAAYMSQRGTALDPASPGDTFASATIGDYYAVVAGRFGWAFDRLLFYVKGGAAFTEARVSISDSVINGNGIISATGGSSFVTWAAGGGLEHAFTGNWTGWTIRGEYLFIDTRRDIVSCGAVVGAATFCWSHELPGTHTAKVGLQCYFGKR